MASTRATKVGLHARLLTLTQSVDQGHQRGEGRFAKLGSQLLLDGAGCRPVLPQVVGTEVSQDDRLLPPAGGRVLNHYVATVAQLPHDLARPLARDTELASDGRNGRSSIQAQSEHPPIGKSSLAEPGIRHGGVEPMLISKPGASQGGSESDGWRSGR